MTDLTGQIGLVTNPTGFWPVVIATVTHSPVYHVVVNVGNDQIVGAEPGGAKLTSTSVYPHVVWSQFDYTDWQRDRVVEYAINHIGWEYNYLDDAAIGIGLLLGRDLTPLFIKARIQDPDALQCAQLADNALLGAGIHVKADHRIPRAIFPGSFVPYFKEQGWWKL